MTAEAHIYQYHKLDFAYPQINWDQDDTPIYYNINENCGDVTGEGSEIQDAFDEWEDDSYSNIDFYYNGTTSVANTDNDEFNVLYWDDLPAGFVAENTYHYLGSGEMVDFNIRFNTDYTWAKSAQSNKYDIRSLATHEIGHSISLDHVNTGTQTMYTTPSTNSIAWRSIESGDEDGVRYVWASYDKPTIEIDEPFNSEVFNYHENVEITASISSTYELTEVKCRITSRDSYDYDSGWQTMTLSGGDYEYTWYNSVYNEAGDFWITIRARTAYGLGVGYVWITSEVV